MESGNAEETKETAPHDETNNQSNNATPVTEEQLEREHDAEQDEETNANEQVGSEEKKEATNA